MNKLKGFDKFVNENTDNQEDYEETDPNQQQNVIIDGGYTGTDITQENIVSHWVDKWKDTCVEDFPNRFLEAFPTRKDYHEFELDKYDYQDEDDEWDFYPEDETFNIQEEFNVVIENKEGKPYNKDHYCHISTEDWVDFYNDMWIWEKIKKK